MDTPQEEHVNEQAESDRGAQECCDEGAHHVSSLPVS